MIRAKESESDLAQSVCREILQDLEDFEYRGETRFRHWLYTTALRKILDRDKYYRRAKRDAAREQPAAADAAPLDLAPVAACYQTVFTPSENAIRREEVEALERAFEQLPDNYRQVITLSRVVGMSHAEIAEKLETSEAYSRNLLSRALARLSRLMRD